MKLSNWVRVVFALILMIGTGCTPLYPLVEEGRDAQNVADGVPATDTTSSVADAGNPSVASTECTMNNEGVLEQCTVEGRSGVRQCLSLRWSECFPFPPVDAGMTTTTDTGIPSDTGTADTGTLDTGTVDTGLADTGTSDSGTADTGTLDTGTVDTGTPDTGTPDTGTVDTGTLDTGTADTGRPDTGSPDTGTPDTGARDTGTVDSGIADTGTPDTGTSDAGPCANDPLRTLVGAVCNNARLGACFRSGTLACNALLNRVECNAPVVTGTLESCNGLDDNCNGLVDEDLGTLTCGNGICSRTMNRCSNGVSQTCTPGTPSASEICGNGVDDNCNGAVDESCTDSGVSTGRIVYEIQTTNSIYTGLIPQLVDRFWAPQTCLNTGTSTMELVAVGFRCIIAVRMDVFNFWYEHPVYGTIGVVQPSSTLPRTCSFMPGVTIRVYTEGTGVSLIPSGGLRTAVVTDQCRVSLL